MRLLRPADYRRMPWKNGGGETIEIAVSPDGAALDAFDWRVSMARVEANGPFSTFPGIDRTLAILDGNGMELAVDGSAPVVLTVASPPHAFPADATTSARLLAGPITDLNVMTRRSAMRHAVRRLPGHGSHVTQTPGVVLTVCRKGEAVVTAGGRRMTVGAGETVVADAGPVDVQAAEGADLFVIEIRP